MTRKLCYLYLTCDEAQKELIARALLEKRLVACAKFLPVDSLYWWQGKLQRDNEILIVFESAEDLFGDIEKELEKIHNYETFVLTATPILRINKKAAGWLNENLQPLSQKARLI